MDKVTKDKICDVVMSYIDYDKMKEITITKNDDGTWKIVGKK